MREQPRAKASYNKVKVLTKYRGYEEEQKPEPKYDVNLFMYNIERHYAECVMLLYGTARTKLMEGTFCHLYKYLPVKLPVNKN